MRLFLFAIGGTGARVVRSLTMLLASGIKGLGSDTEIVPIIIDYDLSNADKKRAVNALKKYSKIHEKLYSGVVDVEKDGFFMTSIVPLAHVGRNNAVLDAKYEVYFGNNMETLNFAEYLGLTKMGIDNRTKATFDLMHALYNNSNNENETELNLNLFVGFKGKPSIGGVVFHQLKNTNEIQHFLSVANASSGDRVFIISSIFGGTGASGFPEIVDLIRGSQNRKVSDLPIGASVVLPYFGLTEVGAINAGNFASKTVAALSYYADPNRNAINQQVNSIYYVGDEKTDNYRYAEGSEQQENDAHIVEFVAATSVIDFLLREQSNTKHVYEYGIETNEKVVKLENFYDVSYEHYLESLSVFAMAFKYYRDVVCGDRKKIDGKTAYYSDKGFDLKKQLNNDELFRLINDFLDVNYKDSNGIRDRGRWGFYPWIDEMYNCHEHKLYLYNLDKSFDISHCLSDRVITSSMFHSAKTSDKNIAAMINKENNSLGNHDVRTFFKILRKVMSDIYSEIQVNIK